MTERSSLPDLPIEALRPEVSFSYSGSSTKLLPIDIIEQVYTTALDASQDDTLDYSIKKQPITPVPQRFGTQLEITDFRQPDIDDPAPRPRLVATNSWQDLPWYSPRALFLGDAQTNHDATLRSSIPGLPFVALSAMCDVAFSKGTASFVPIQSKLQLDVPREAYANDLFRDGLERVRPTATAIDVLGMDNHIRKPSSIILANVLSQKNAGGQRQLLFRLFSEQSVLAALEHTYGTNSPDVAEIYASAVTGNDSYNFVVETLLKNLGQKRTSNSTSS